ncbi:rhamnan synthesis F family protein [Croceicoccus marinus]|uniref:Uncharacterized protein n=1 Tax=Croceicoccus marinus TaxID=450378 RepID=A0A7G6VWS6_9SPHN|nr:rhamnan synthesis F family protein [Croceicoccus marinus]QNE06191.1 hypothetical protein H4O24_06140 [Croceicoccus marinus]
MTRRLTLFASFHNDAAIPPYIRHHLIALRQYSDRLIFISNSPVSKEGQRFLASIDSMFVQRPNVGYDFAAWRDGLELCDARDFDEVLLTNSSIIGPIRDLGAVFDQMRSRPCDFWGLTTSFGAGCKHLQSFFLVFRKNVVMSRSWSDWWSEVEDLSDKEEVIRRYEVPLYRFFVDAGYIGTSYLPPPGRMDMARIFLRKREGILPAVPALLYWTNGTVNAPVKLVRQGFPYIKASLIWGHNRRQGIDLARLRQVPDVSYDWDIIQP